MATDSNTQLGGEATPGPWRVEDGANSHCFGGRLMAGDECIAFVDLDTPDAYLIAAAPDLLEELEQQADGCSLIISLLGGQQSAVASSLVGMLRFQEANARAALAKAHPTELSRVSNGKDENDG